MCAPGVQEALMLDGFHSAWSCPSQGMGTLVALACGNWCFVAMVLMEPLRHLFADTPCRCLIMSCQCQHPCQAAPELHRGAGSHGLGRSALRMEGCRCVRVHWRYGCAQRQHSNSIGCLPVSNQQEANAERGSLSRSVQHRDCHCR